jgi:apolipoprotein N-acyltransferase
MSLASRQSGRDFPSASSRDVRSEISELAISATPLSDAASMRLGTLICRSAIDLALPIASGILLAVAFMAPPLDLVAWVALIPFAAAIARPRGSIELYSGAYLGGVAFSLHGQSWILTRLTGSGPFESNAADWFVNGCIQAAVWPLMLYIARRLAQRGRWQMVVLLPVVWVAGEFIRQEAGWAIAWSPFPWLQLGLTQAERLPLAQVADLGGVWAIAFVVAAVNGALFAALFTRQPRPLATAALILAGTWVYGEFRMRPTVLERGPSMALVPPYGRLPDQQRGADIMLWSETAYALVISESELKELETKARDLESGLIVGSIRREGSARYNSAVVIDPEKGYLGCYDKCFLVPWGEFRPWSFPVPGTPGQGFTRGARQPVFRIANYTCGATICYDVCFDRLFRRFKPTPDFFVCLSREATDPTGFVPRNLLKMARLRAIESRRPIIRNVEGGFSGIVTSTGEFVSAPPRPWSAPIQVGHVPIDRRASAALAGGNWIPLAACVVILGAGIRGACKRGPRGAGSIDERCRKGP